MSSTLPYDVVLKAPFGWLGIRCDGQAVISIDFLEGHAWRAHCENSPLAVRAATQIEAFLQGKLMTFDLPLAPAGTPYMRKVWTALLALPYGHTETYGTLAARLGSGPRAIGNACRRNSIPLIIPCHRVVRANDAGGYMGQTQGRAMDIKYWLLAHEARVAH